MQTGYASDTERWLATRARDARADGHFCYVVTTTGVYNRPTCELRPARRENILFFATPGEARSAGFRPCHRCCPDTPDRHSAALEVVARACRMMDEFERAPSLDELAYAAGYSRFHFHRMFKAVTGITPHAYLAAGRARRVRDELAVAERISDAIYNSGFNSNGHFYASSPEILGMTPKSFRAGGLGTVIRAATGSCSLGPALVAATDKGVCAVLTAAPAEELTAALFRQFPRAGYLFDDARHNAVVQEALRRGEPPALGQRLPVRVRRVVLTERVRRLVRASAAAA